ncbi:MAG: hypothetical protein PHI98_13660 [Eubacteriales bacterium]|nr:hypothetical protein [Eubacteriales bacterium]
MKRLALCLLLLCLLSSILNSACADQITVATDGSIRFGGSSSYVYPYPTLELKDGRLLIALLSKGGVDDGTDSLITKTWLICLNQKGSADWYTDITEDMRTMVASMAEQPDGTVLVTTHAGKYEYRRQSAYSLRDGALLWQSNAFPVISDDLLNDENIGISYTTVGGRYLREEIHDQSATTRPRYFQLEEANGEVLWRLNENEIGGGHTYHAIAVSTGTLCFGGCFVDDQIKPGAQLVSNEGDVQWCFRLEDTTVHWNSAMETSEGMLVMAGESGGVGEEELRVVVCLDPAKEGKLLWQSASPVQEDRALCTDCVLETEQGYLLSGANRGYHGSAFLLLDQQGKELAYWEDAHWENEVYQSHLFKWRGQAWTCVVMSGADSERITALSPVIYP